MQTTVQVDDTLWQQAIQVSGQQTPQTLLLEALREYVQYRQQSTITNPPMTWDTFFAQPSVFDDNFLAKRDNAAPQEREML